MSTEGISVLSGNTKRITAKVGSTISSVKMTTATGFPPAGDYTISNFGPNVAFVGWGPDSDTAIANADVPATGDTTGKFCFIVYPGQRTIEAKDGAYFAAVTSIGTADILITPGRGLVDGFGDGNVVNDLSNTVATAAMLSVTWGAQMELLQLILIEMRTQTDFLKQGLNVAEDPDVTRSDQAAIVNLN